MATRFDPFQDLERLFNSMTTNSRNAGVLPTDLKRVGDKFILSMDLPGVDASTIDVSVEDRTLTISAERKNAGEEGDWLVRERPTGAVARQLALGRGLALDKISADYADGVLTLTIPVSEQAKPRRIEVSHTGQPTEIGSGEN